MKSYIGINDSKYGTFNDKFLSPSPLAPQNSKFYTSKISFFAQNTLLLSS